MMQKAPKCAVSSVAFSVLTSTAFIELPTILHTVVLETDGQKRLTIWIQSQSTQKIHSLIAVLERVAHSKAFPSPRGSQRLRVVKIKPGVFTVETLTHTYTEQSLQQIYLLYFFCIYKNSCL